MNERRPEFSALQFVYQKDNLPFVSTRERLFQPFVYDKQALLTDLVRVKDRTPVYPGYPSQGLTMTEAEYDTWVANGRPIELLTGIPKNQPSYFLEHHINRYESNGNPRSKYVWPYDGTVKFKHPNLPGVEWASDGTPLHPYLKFLLTKTKRGVVTGPGWFWGLGESETVDSAYLRENLGYLEVLLILRKDVRVWAFPGGFKNISHKQNSVFGLLEDSLLAARRESREETGISMFRDIPASKVIENVLVADPRATAQAWTRTTFYRFTPNSVTGLHMVPLVGDDAVDARWFNVARGFDWKGARSNDLYASHSSLLRLAIQDWQRETGKVVRFDGKIGRPKPNETMFDSVLPQLREKIYSISQSLMRRNG